MGDEVNTRVSNFFPADFNDFSDAEDILSDIRDNSLLYGSDSEDDNDLEFVCAPVNSTAIIVSPTKGKENLSDTIVNSVDISLENTVESSQPLRKRGIRKPEEWKQSVRKKTVPVREAVCIDDGYCSSSEKS